MYQLYLEFVLEGIRRVGEKRRVDFSEFSV